MGLSKEERMSGIIRNIGWVVSHAQQLEEHPEIKRRCLNLWHDFLWKQTNSGHWLLGSSATNKVHFGNPSLWGVPIYDAVQEAIKEKSDLDTILEKHEQEFDIRAQLSVQRLLSATDKDLSLVYRIFATLEQLVYYLRRYFDDLAQDLSRLSRSVSVIMGLCNAVFVGHKNQCAKAYLLSNMFSDVFLLPPYNFEEDKDKWDIVAQVIDGFHLWHHIPSVMKYTSEVSLTEIVKMSRDFLRMKNEGKLSTIAGVEARLFAVLKLCGRHFHYDHEHKRLRSLLREKRVKIDRKKLDRILSECKKAYEAHNKEEQQQYQKDSAYTDMTLFEV